MHQTDQQLDSQIEGFLSRKFNQFPEITTNSVSMKSMRQIERIER